MPVDARIAVDVLLLEWAIIRAALEVPAAEDNGL